MLKARFLPQSHIKSPVYSWPAVGDEDFKENLLFVPNKNFSRPVVPRKRHKRDLRKKRLAASPAES